MKRYRVIFLDVDGVLNSVRWYGKYHFRHRYRGDRLKRSFDPAAVKRLNYIVAATGAKVVLSSTWRLGGCVHGLQRMFDKVGAKIHLVGITGRYTHHEVTIPRGVEIKDYYSKAFDHPSFYDKCPSKLKGYVIIDDDSDMLYEQRNNFLQTNNQYGLVDDDVPKAINILMTDLPEVSSYYGQETKEKD